MNILRRYKLIDSLIVLLLAVTLIAPLFRVVYLDIWTSIESTFIADARYLAEHLPHPGWQPLWYCGTRFDYVYPPALRYGTAFISIIGHMSTAHAYHIYTGAMYVLGILSIYWLLTAAGQSRRAAYMSTAAVALLSPSLILVRALHNDSPWMIPQRLHVLMWYGEGPHISSVSMLGAALAASFVALRWKRWDALAIAAALSSFTVANNFYGATSLAYFFPILVWSVWLGTRDNSVFARAIGIGALAYGLSAFWLSPSFMRITIQNLRWVSSPADPKSRVIMLLAAALCCSVSYQWANRRADRIWAVFTGISAVIFGINVLGTFFFDFHVFGEAARLAPEMDLAFLLFGVVILDALLNVKGMRLPAVMLTTLFFAPSVIYLQHAWTPFPRDLSWENRYERHIARWVAENLPGERTMPSGTVRFWYDAWWNNVQMDGGSDQGIDNQSLMPARFQIVSGSRADVSILWMQAFGTSAVVVPDKTSLEPYKDYATPLKFQGAVPLLFDDGHGTRIYRIPRIYPAIARVVDQTKIAQVPMMRSGEDFETLQQYVSIVEAPQRESHVAWLGTDEVKVDATTAQGQTVLLQESYDPDWHAYENAARLPIRMDRFSGFMLVDVPPGKHTLDFRFETPLDNRVGRVVSLFSLGLAAWLVKKSRTRQFQSVPHQP